MHNMHKLSKFFFFACGVSILTTLIIANLKNPAPQHVEFISLAEKPKPKILGPEFQGSFKEFSDPKMAFYILSQLDPTPALRLFSGDRNPHKGKFMYGLIKDDAYCLRNLKYFTENPMQLFEGPVNIVSTSLPESFYRQHIDAYFNDVYPEIGDQMALAKKNSASIPLRPDITLWCTKYQIFSKWKIGSQFSCLAQASNHLPRRDTLDRKDTVAENAIRYARKFENRLECFNHDKFFPETWLLDKKKDCVDFFKILNSAEYQKMKQERRIVYIRKVSVGSHKGEGVQPVNDQEEKELKALFGNGQKCGKILNKKYIVQYYIHNPLLLEGRKFDFRMYMLIASTNPLMVYYHDGFLRVTLAKYDINSDDKDVFLTNLALNQHFYNDIKEGKAGQGMDNEAALRYASQWTFDRLQNYLLDKKIIRDKNWLDNYLRPELKKAMVHLLRLSSHNFQKHSTIFELYGVDFMLDENLNLWFIEANSSPAFNKYYDSLERFITKMLQDHYEIVLGLLRSRMKRVVQFVHGIIDAGGIQKEVGRITIPDIKKRRDIFKQITKNYFEKEFEPNPTNGFVKIIDENYQGVEAYQGLIPQQCL